MTTAGVIGETVSALPSGAFIRSKDLPGPRTAVDMALSRLASPTGPLVRVSNGVYWKGLSSRFGKGRPSSLDAALNIAGRGAGPAGWSALHYLGLTTQVPATLHIATVGRKPQILSTRISIRSNLDRVDLAPAEIAILEVLRDEWSALIDGGLPALRNVIDEFAKKNSINLARLEGAVTSERKPKVREHWRTLGFVIR
jgi:hypothetical protein